MLILTYNLFIFVYLFRCLVAYNIIMINNTNIIIINNKIKIFNKVKLKLELKTITKHTLKMIY